jgi:hypothetical protein
LADYTEIVITTSPRPLPQPPLNGPTPERKWTVLMWSACDNDLYECCVNDLDKSEQGAHPAVQVVAQVDHRPNPRAEGAHTVQRLELQRDDQALLHSPVKADLGDANMACPKSLADFVEWGIKNYPAENYWLVISDHGDGWKGASQDDGHHDWMSLPQIESALQEVRQKTGRKLDLLSFDCCHMASAEVAHQLQNEARYMVASQEVMGYLGLPYTQLLPEAAELNPRQLAEHIVRSSAANPEDIPTFSALDLEKAPQLTEAIQELGAAILASPLQGAQLREVLGETQAYWEYRDVHQLAQRLAEHDPALESVAARVQAAVGELVIAEQHASSHPGSHGVHLEVQRDSEELRQQRYARGSLNREDTRLWKTELGRYADTAFAQATEWPRVIEKIQG